MGLPSQKVGISRGLNLCHLHIRPHRREAYTYIRMQDFRENLSTVNNTGTRPIEIRISVNDKHSVSFYGKERIPLWMGHEG
jgi:hypothetical protein